MKKNRLLLDQKRFLSFSNYRNIINDLLNENNIKTIIINSRKSTISLDFFDKIKNSEITNNSNISIFRSRSNSLINKNIRLLSFNKIKSKLDVSNKFNFDIGKSQRNNIHAYKSSLNINKFYLSHVNQLLKINNSIFHFHKKFENIFEKNNKSNLQKFENKKIINKTALLDFNSIERFGNKNFNNNPTKLIKMKSENITSRKLSKELFRNDANGIVVKKKGKKKVKYKIIGTLTTEPTLKSHNN